MWSTSNPQASATQWHRARADKSPHVQPTHPAGLADLLKSAEAQGVDWVLIDTAAQTDSTAAEAIDAADVVLVTCRPSIVDLRAITNTIRLCRIRDVTPHVVLTQTEAHGTLQEEARRSLEAMRVDVLPQSLGRRAAFHHSMIDGRAATEYEPRGKAAQEARELYRAICRIDGMTTRRRDDIPSTRAGSTA
ncbi:MAG: cellulose synthase operon protein YhjQ/BcsQ [Polyangiaceae bacterium]